MWKKKFLHWVRPRCNIIRPTCDRQSKCLKSPENNWKWWQIVTLPKLYIMTKILPKLLVYRYRECISFGNVFWKNKRFLLDEYVILIILTDDQKRVRVQTAKQLLEHIFNIQSKTICKYWYCYWWRTISSLFRTSKKNWKQNIANRGGANFFIRI